MIDTHIHLDNPLLSEDREQVMARASAAGVTHFYIPNVDDESWPRMEALQKIYPEQVRLMLGLHPCHVDTAWETTLDRYEKRWETSPEKYIAVGEIGLDLYWDKTSLDRQVLAFERQLDWAVRWNKPVSIHVRDAWEPMMEVLRGRKGKGLKGVLHCFSGTQEVAEELISMGFYLGIGGVVTYKKTNVMDVLRSVGMDRVVLETDAPYLSPVPARGKRNEPSHLAFVRDFLATGWGVSSAEVDRVTTENAHKVFTFA